MNQRNVRTERRPFGEQMRSDDFAAFARYAVVGAAQNAFFYGLILIAVSFHFRAWQAILLTYPVAVAASFAANRFWSFASRRRTPREIRKYLLLYAATYPLAVSMTWAQEHAGVPSWLASLNTVMIAAAGVFFLLNYWVFPKTAAT